MLNHPHVLNYLEVYEDKKAIYIVQEFCKNGTLEQLIQKHLNKVGTALNEADSSLVCGKILLALNYCH